MSQAYRQLLDATIRHLQDLKNEGERLVQVSPEILAALAKPAPRRKTAPARPALPPPPKAASARPVSAPANHSVLFSVSPEPMKNNPAPLAAASKPAPLSADAKEAALAELRAKALACVKCPHLAASRTQVVFGVGTPQAELMFVGEAPGADEDAQGEPFVGLAGQLLTKIITTMGLSRQQVYIGNILKCRPDTPGQSAGNRPPRPEEMQTCLPWLHQQIDIIQPKVLVALGATAVTGLLGKTIGITKLRGHWQTYRGIPLMPTYHPAYLLRNQSLAEKRKVWEDMLQVMEKLGREITAKQRGFFLAKS